MKPYRTPQQKHACHKLFPIATGREPHKFKLICLSCKNKPYVKWLNEREYNIRVKELGK